MFTTIEQALDYIAKNRTTIVQVESDDTKSMLYNSYASRIGETFQFGEVKAKLIDIIYYNKTNQGALRWELPYDLILKERKIDEKG